MWVYHTNLYMCHEHFRSKEGKARVGLTPSCFLFPVCTLDGFRIQPVDCDDRTLADGTALTTWSLTLTRPALSPPLSRQGSMVTMDMRMDRVRVYCNADDIVTRPPRVG